MLPFWIILFSSVGFSSRATIDYVQTAKSLAQGGAPEKKFTDLLHNLLQESPLNVSWTDLESIYRNLDFPYSKDFQISLIPLFIQIIEKKLQNPSPPIYPHFLHSILSFWNRTDLPGYSIIPMIQKMIPLNDPFINKGLLNLLLNFTRLNHRWVDPNFHLQGHKTSKLLADYFNDYLAPILKPSKKEKDNIMTLEEAMNLLMTNIDSGIEPTKYSLYLFTVLCLFKYPKNENLRYQGTTLNKFRDFLTDQKNHPTLSPLFSSSFLPEILSVLPKYVTRVPLVTIDSINAEISSNRYPKTAAEFEKQISVIAFTDSFSGIPMGDWNRVYLSKLLALHPTNNPMLTEEALDQPITPHNVLKVTADHTNLLFIPVLKAIKNETFSRFDVYRSLSQLFWSVGGTPEDDLLFSCISDIIILLGDRLFIDEVTGKPSISLEAIIAGLYRFSTELSFNWENIEDFLGKEIHSMLHVNESTNPLFVARSLLVMERVNISEKVKVEYFMWIQNQMTDPDQLVLINDVFLALGVDMAKTAGKIEKGPEVIDVALDQFEGEDNVDGELKINNSDIEPVPDQTRTNVDPVIPVKTPHAITKQNKVKKDPVIPKISNRKPAASIFRSTQADPRHNKRTTLNIDPDISKRGIDARENTPERISPDKINPDKTNPKKINPDKINPKINPGKSNTGKINPEKINAGKINAGKINAGKINAGKINTGQSNTGETNTGEHDDGEDNDEKTSDKKSPDNSKSARIRKGIIIGFSVSAGFLAFGCGIFAVWYFIV
jgi:Pentapeptide repeats (8 copies)